MQLMVQVSLISGGFTTNRSLGAVKLCIDWVDTMYRGRSEYIGC